MNHEDKRRILIVDLKQGDVFKKTFENAITKIETFDVFLVVGNKPKLVYFADWNMEYTEYHVDVLNVTKNTYHGLREALMLSCDAKLPKKSMFEVDFLIKC